MYKPPSNDRDSVNRFNTDSDYILKVTESKAKTVLLAEDFNPDLLKCNNHGPTGDF